MKTYKLGELITQRREKNNETGLPIRGVSREGLIPPKQIDADTSIYNVFYLRDFIFNPARMELNSIAFNDKYEKAICSSLYEVFYVHREDIVLPEYLKLIVKQDWFTRYCEFLGQGSAREYCRFANISEINIELPDIETQKKAVYCDKVINERIALKRRINDNLDAQLRAYMANFMAKDDNPVIGKLKDYCTMQYGYTESSSVDPVGPKFLRITDIAQKSLDWSSVPYCPINDGNHSKYMLSEGDILVARTGATVGVAKMMGSHIPDAVFASFLVRIKPIESYYKYYFGLTITSNAFLEYVQTNAGGSAQPQANPPLLGEFEFAVPKPDQMIEFNSVASRFLDAMEQNELEMSKLSELKESLVNMLSSR